MDNKKQSVFEETNELLLGMIKEAVPLIMLSAFVGVFALLSMFAPPYWYLLLLIPFGYLMALFIIWVERIEDAN